MDASEVIVDAITCRAIPKKRAVSFTLDGNRYYLDIHHLITETCNPVTGTKFTEETFRLLEQYKRLYTSM